MLRFIKHNLTSMDNIEIYPLISLLIFVLFFATMLFFVFSMKKKDVIELSSMPFEGEVDLDKESDK